MPKHRTSEYDKLRSKIILQKKREVHGRLAYHPVQDEKGNWILGIVEERVAGYSPYEVVGLKSEADARAYADELNDRMGVDGATAAIIVATSMRFGPGRRRRG